MRRLTVKPGRIKTKLGPTDDGLARDTSRRLRNALLALAWLDPGWMYWVEKNIPKTMNLLPKTRQIERQARLKAVGRYTMLGRAHFMGIVYSDFHFTDDGNLKTYL